MENQIQTPAPSISKDPLLKYPPYVYSLTPDILESLSIKSFAPDEQQRDSSNQAPSYPPETLPSVNSVEQHGPSQGTAPACSHCALSFASADDLRRHNKSDLHQYNLKQKLRGLKLVSESEFDALLEKLDESISGSDSSAEEEDNDDLERTTDSRKETTLTTLLRKQAMLADKQSHDDVVGDEGDEHGSHTRSAAQPRSPFVWFTSPVLSKNQYFGAYRALFTPEELVHEHSAQMVEAIRKRQLEPTSMHKPVTPCPQHQTAPHVFLCMIGGGHFAGMAVSLAPPKTKDWPRMARTQEGIVLAHQSFHRYTTRRKQGGSQSANDNAKGVAHSAGSNLRRYNEQALVKDVRGLLNEWKALIDTAELLFVRATGVTNRRTLFGPYDDQVLRANDARIRHFPFTTRRATKTELMRAFIELTRMKTREILPASRPDPGTHGAPKSAAAKPQKATEPAVAKLSEEEKTALLHTSQLQALIRRSKLPALLSYLQTNSLSADFELQPHDHHHRHAPTPLHLAAAQGSVALVSGLLVCAGADPTKTNAEGRTAFELAKDRATRDAFRVARHELGEDQWAWKAAAVPAPLTRGEAEQREERERKEKERQESERRRVEEARLEREGPRVSSKTKPASTAGLMPTKTAQDIREQEARGLTPEQWMKLERERRARAAEARIRKLQGVDKDE